MTPLLDRLARSLAGAPTGDAAGDRFARDAFLRRGFTGALALTTLGSLIGAPGANAATCPGGSLQNCRQRAYTKLRKSVVNVCGKEPSVAKKFGCLETFVDEHEVLRGSCERRCPTPKPKRSSGSQPKRKRRAPSPPPLPPNPYDDGGLCPDCVAANNGNAICCWGGPLPGGYCGCGPGGDPAESCKAIGC